MINLKNNALLFIEPTTKGSKMPVNDAISIAFEINLSIFIKAFILVNVELEAVVLT